ncbi:aldo/keto reductase [Streptomyces albofaciens JCM 4342]|uniref:aldo/keto reductase n=1 Tax=Streptomyces albofaciens TaxID=66866 RepID=UPI00123B8E81|nr:aldo/keto reductase [Streptomyces albofaciens]KAA6213164.1 aldo/keto reductase [Streptomyces albofaciens JCM 4342]
MRTLGIGPDGTSVGAVGLGCMGMSYAYDPGGRDDDASVAVLHRALDLGVDLIDTADVYGPYTNEELVGRALADRRGKAFLATKAGFVAGETRLRRNGRPEHIRAAIDASLRRLRTDHVDLYQLHRVDPEVPLEETWGAMAEAVRAGKARMLGLSDVTVEQVRTAQRVHPVAAVQAELSLWTREATAELLPFTAREDIALIAYAPLGRGFLAGRFGSARDLPDGDYRRVNPRFQEENFAANLRLLDGVRRVARRRGVTPAQTALAWVLAQGDHVVPIPGTKHVRYLEANAAAAGIRLTGDDLALLDGLPAAVGARQ